jgi:sterol 3beta-glucosyltransferase
MANVAVIGLGTRGDVEPAVALAAEFQRRGHHVRIAVPLDFVGLTKGLGLETVPIGIDVRAALATEKYRKRVATTSLVKLVLGARKVVRASMGPLHKAVLDVTDDADVIVVSKTAEDSAAVAAEAAGIPLVSFHPAPMRANGRVPSFLVTTRRLPPVLNRLTHLAIEYVTWRGLSSQVNELRGQLGLPPTRKRTPVRLAEQKAIEIQGYSRFLVPELADWEPRRPLVGPLRLSEQDKVMLGASGVEEGLVQWITAGDAPVYFGFGSMPITDPAGMMRTIRDVCGSLGTRGLVNAGWNKLPDDDDDLVMVTGNLDFDQVLPLCRVAVHQGGSGTTAASVEAGVPTLVCSAWGDNSFWGTRLERAGIGLHIPFKELTPSKLTAALRHLMQPAVADAAAAFGESCRTDRGGVARAVEIVEQHVLHL